MIGRDKRLKDDKAEYEGQNGRMNGEKGKKTGEEKRKRKRREREKERKREQGRKRERENYESDSNDDFKSRSVNMNAKIIDKNVSGDAASRRSRLRIKACEKRM